MAAASGKLIAEKKIWEEDRDAAIRLFAVASTIEIPEAT